MIDHVTIHVPLGTLDRLDLPRFFRFLGMEEVSANDPMYEHVYRVRWFAPFDHGDEPPRKPFVHLVETDDGEHDLPVLGHFCIAVGGRLYASLAREGRRKGWVTRYSASGRFWCEFANIRVEVRP